MKTPEGLLGEKSAPNYKNRPEKATQNGDPKHRPKTANNAIKTKKATGIASDRLVRCIGSTLRVAVSGRLLGSRFALHADLCFLAGQYGSNDLHAGAAGGIHRADHVLVNDIRAGLHEDDLLG